MTKILVTGKSGQLGWELQRSLAPLGEMVAFDRHGLDLSSSDSIASAIRREKPDIIANAGAYTAVDKAESEPELAMRINGIAPGILAEEAKRTGALLIHYSTDYVFDGTKNGPYRESDVPSPVSSYGRSKLQGENAIMAAGGSHLLFRTSWVYASRGTNFLCTMLRLARERPELKIVDDQLGAPTWARSIADMTAQVLGNPARARENSGIYHFTAAGAVTWFGFAEAIFRHMMEFDGAFRAPRLTPIPSSDYPTPARRPMNSRLNTAKFSDAFGLIPSHWEGDLKACLKEISQQEAGSKISSQK
jgi:dTDP-4-dehydrorhamnose reductase